MPNIAHKTSEIGSIGAPSPPEAWVPPDDPASFTRHPLRFAAWVADRHRETLDDNPIYRKSARRRYVRRSRRLHPVLREILAAIAFAAVALLFIHVIRHYNKEPQAALPWRYFLPVVGGMFLVSLFTTGFTATRHASGFIKATDRAMMWEDLIQTPLREEHYLWGWLWSPLIERIRGIALAVAFGTVGVWFSPFQSTFNYNPMYCVPVSPALLALSILLLGALGLAWSLGVGALGLIQSLDLGPRLYDAAGVLWGLFHVLPLGLGFAMGLAAGGFLIAGANDDPAWYPASILFSMAGLAVVAWGDWLAVQYLLPGFWDALLARRSVRGQISWWRALMGK